MRLVRQVNLFFKEGNSDKVYEIDLCETGNDRYVVNFRYGRRGTTLKEGTKTTEPVSREKADSLFNALEAEKRGKGYRAAGESAIPAAPVTFEADVAIPDINWNDWPAGRSKAILQRLHAAVEGRAGTAKHAWKTSRVVWMAGVIRLDAAVPYIINLAAKGDGMMQYAAAWALGRIGDGSAVSLLKTFFQSASGSSLKRIAGDALLLLLRDDERKKHLEHFLNSLPEPIKLAVENDQPEQLTALLSERVVNQEQPHYSMLEDLYAVAIGHKWIKPVLKNILLQLPLRPGHFRHIRHIYKLAEFRDDFDMLGALSCKFEREQEMFRQSRPDHDSPTYVPEIEEWVETKKELSKKTSRIAYSNRTRQYLRKRTLRVLNNYGKYDDLNYVRMATGLLLAYDGKRDHSAPFSTSYHGYKNGRFQLIERRYPANAHAVYLNQVLFGNAASMFLRYDNTWVFADEDGDAASSQRKQRTESTERSWGGLFKKIISLFGGKKKDTPASPLPEAEPALRESVKPAARQHRDAPYIHLWDKLPQAYVQLLMHGQMNEVHEFALSNLQSHQDYNEIKEKLDNYALELLLTAEYDIPANFGYTLALERYNPQQPDRGLVKALFYSRLPAARNTARQWVDESPDTFLQESEFVASLLFCPHEEIRKWIVDEISRRSYTPVQAQLICGRVIGTALASRSDTESTNVIIGDAGESIVRLFSSQLRDISLQVAQDLVKSPVAAAQVLGLKILLLKKDTVNFDELSSDVFSTLLNSRHQLVREKGVELLQELSTKELLKRQELIIHCCISPYTNVRSGIRPVIKRMATADTVFGTYAVNWLMPLLLRKENSEGEQHDISEILVNELIAFINNADKEMVLRLIYAQYVPAQRFGIAVLERYIDPASFTIRQIIALGNHETLSVREWCWKYFIGNVARIKFEREEAIRLLDAKWDDTREFAKQFFRDNFSENDWSPETLVGIADSVRPDIEAFGRELITRYFNEKDGVEYLLKLSQHPGEKMQLFATNYLERFASGNIGRIAALEFYFKSVLARVNKARVAKNRIFLFLQKEGRQSEEAAGLVVRIINIVSATVSIEDKAKCIEILYELNKLYKLETPIVIHPVEERI